MIKLAASLLSAFSLLWAGLAGGIWWADYRPAGWPNYAVHVGPFKLFTVHFKDTARVTLATLQKAEEAAARHSARVVAAQSAVAATASLHEAAAQVQIRTVYRTIHDEVHVYVTNASDARCVVPVGFVRIHDAAAGGVPPGPETPGQPDDAPSGVALSAVASTVADNYGAAVENAQQLTALQAWIEAVSKVGD